jgi:thioredoxin reductase (NADPH)
MMYDVAVVGAGPAGLSASVALACEGKSVVLIDKAYNVGGQIAHSHLVENVVGYPNGFSGEDFALQAYTQAVGLGVDIMLGHQVVEVLGWPGRFGLLLHGAGMPSARAVLITVGVAPRPLPFAVVMEEGKGCNVTNELHLLPASSDERVLVYGGGNSAGQAASYYAKRGCSVTLMSRRPVVETMDARWITTLARLGVYNVVGEIAHVSNDTVVFECSGVVQQLIPHTLHAFTGGEPETGWLTSWVELDADGYIVTDEQHCTTTYGIFAAGDCEAGGVKKFTCAVGGGCEAVPAIGKYLSVVRL